MNKIKVNNTIVARACDMRPGHIGQVIKTGEYVIKDVFDHLVSLSDGSYWVKDCQLEIQLLPPGSILTIEINND